MRRCLVVLVGVAALFLSVAAPAGAYEPEYWTHVGNRSSIISYLAKGGPSDQPISQVNYNDPRATSWWEAEHRPYPGAPKSSTLWQDLRAVRGRLGILPKLATITKFAKWTAGGLALSVAIEYGPGLLQEIGIIPEQTDPAQDEAGFVGVRLVDRHDWIPGTAMKAPYALRLPVFETQNGPVSPMKWFDPKIDECHIGYEFVPDLLAFPALPGWSGSRLLAAVVGSNRGVFLDTIEQGEEYPYIGGGVGSCPNGTVRAVVVDRLGPVTSTPPPDADVVEADPWTMPGDADDIWDDLQDVIADYPELSQHFDHLVEPEQVEDPYPTYSTVPSCEDMVWADCKAAIEEVGLVPVREPLRWDDEDLEVEQPPGWVIDVPDKGAEVEEGTEVEVETNPDKKKMPLIVPLLPEDPNEDWSSYRRRAREAGFPEVGAVYLPESAPNTNFGPNAATEVEPLPGSRANPSEPPAITVTVNPPSAPPVAGGSGGSCDTKKIRAFDLGPFLGIDTSNVFPFGVVGWLADTLSAWVVDPPAPAWELPMGSFTLDVDLDRFSPVMSVIRPVMVIVATLGFAWMLASSALGIDRGNDD